MGRFETGRPGGLAQSAVSLGIAGLPIGLQAEPTGLQAEPINQIAVLVIDPRNLDRECLVRTISLSYPDIATTGYGSLEAWRAVADSARPKVVIYRLSRSSDQASRMSEEVERVVKELGDVPVIVVGDSEDVRDMVDVFNCGARGYVPSSVGVGGIVEAARLSFTNGVFLPLSSIQALRDAFVMPPKAQREDLGRFTERQMAVCEALRRGKSNKIIAYELNLCESTVKVHIRTIMKKLRASNRTEAAFKLNAVCFGNQA